MRELHIYDAQKNYSIAFSSLRLIKKEVFKLYIYIYKNITYIYISYLLWVTVTILSSLIFGKFTDNIILFNLSLWK